MCRLVVLLFALSIAAGGCKDASEAPKADEPKKTEKKTKAEEPSGPSQAEVDKSKAEFQAYQNKAKTTEAMDQLDKIYKGAAAYFSTPRFSQLGEEIPCQFPASVPATPSPKGCADAAVDKDGDGRCDPDFATWDTPTWSALMFQVSDPHYYVYQFDSNGTGADATFTATAFGDLDKDGVLSTFQRTGKGQIDEYGCSAKAAGAITTENELE